MKLLIALCLFLVVGCTALDWQQKSVSEITTKTSRNMHSHAITQFEIKSVGIGERTENGRWYLSSGDNYRSADTLNVHLTPDVAAQLSDKYGVEKPSNLLGKTIRVKGTVTPKYYCVTSGCPLKLGRKKPEMYIQSQMLITDIDNISLL